MGGEILDDDTNATLDVGGIPVNMSLFDQL